MMMKKKIGVKKEASSLLLPFFSGGDEASARFKYCYLFQDYQELLKETRAKKERLEKLLQKKHQLLGEIKFLRRKCRRFSTSRSTRIKLKKQSCGFELLPLKSGSQIVKQFPAGNSTGIIDLNKVFLPTIEEMEGLEAEQKPENVDWFKRLSSEGVNLLANDSSRLICRDSGIGTSKAGKRKVSWQDQLSLKV